VLGFSTSEIRGSLLTVNREMLVANYFSKMMVKSVGYVNGGGQRAIEAPAAGGSTGERSLLD
jgi:hypothetical protein